MSDIALRFTTVSKRYRLHRRWAFASLQEAAVRLGRRLLRRETTGPEFVWALRDINLDIPRGQTVGLIGSNGSGKSTLLKILARVTVPTSGSFDVNGRLGALIEVGAGFHPDLSGRENVYLNGAIMGMSRAEIDAKFERIVAFSEISRFIDTPIKFYSSGMQVRLGFAVAAHVDPDILLVDEVLAVGDAAFQAKCLDKIAELRERATTIVLVSHNMANIVQHCDRVIWLDAGTMRLDGEPESVVDQYLRTVRPVPVREHVLLSAQPSPVRITGVRVRDGAGVDSDVVRYGETCTIDVSLTLDAAIDDPVVSVGFHDLRGSNLGWITTRFSGFKLDSGQPALVARLTLTPVLFTRGTYGLSVAVLDNRLQRHLALLPSAGMLHVEGPGLASREVGGHVVYPHTWSAEPVAD